MNKTIKRILTLALVAIMVAALAVPTMAADPAKITDGTVWFTKDFVIGTDVTAVPTQTFEFTLTGISGNSSADNKITNHTGVVNTNIVWGSSITSTGGSGTLNFGSSDSVGSGTVSKSFSINFSGLIGNGITEPGVYSYTLTEKSNTGDGITYSDKTFYIDVYVGYETNASTDNTLKILNVVVSETKGTGSGNSLTYGEDGKIDASENGGGSGRSGAVFTNTRTAYTLTVTKTVTGNQGDKNKHFTIHIELSNVSANTTYTIVPTCDDSLTPSNPTNITVTNGTGSTDVYLKNGESVTIKGLPYGTTYTVTETGAPTGYTVSISDNGTGSLTTGNGSVTVTNDKDGFVPTGILLTVAPFAVLMIVGAAGVTVILKRKHS